MERHAPADGVDLVPAALLAPLAAQNHKRLPDPVVRLAFLVCPAYFAGKPLLKPSGPRAVLVAVLVPAGPGAVRPLGALASSFRRAAAAARWRGLAIRGVRASTTAVGGPSHDSADTALRAGWPGLPQLGGTLLLSPLEMTGVAAEARIAGLGAAVAARMRRSTISHVGPLQKVRQPSRCLLLASAGAGTYCNHSTGFSQVRHEKGSSRVMAEGASGWRSCPRSYRQGRRSGSRPMAESNRPDLCIKQEVSLTCAPGTAYAVSPPEIKAASGVGQATGRSSRSCPQIRTDPHCTKHPSACAPGGAIQLSILPEIRSAAGLLTNALPD